MDKSKSKKKLATESNGLLTTQKFIEWYSFGHKDDASNVKILEINEDTSQGYFRQFKTTFQKMILNVPRLTELEQLTITGKQTYETQSFPVIPTALNKLNKLKSLKIENCQIEDIKSLLKNNPALVSLEIINCNLTEFPAETENLGNLKRLNLSDNNISVGIPDWISRLPLVILILAGNQITAIPESIGNMTTLKVLNLGSNNINDLPDSLERIYPNIRTQNTASRGGITPQLVLEGNPILQRRINDFRAPVRRIMTNFITVVEEPTVNQNNMPPLPGGIAFEVHNAFKKINKEKLNNFFKSKMEESLTPVKFIVPAQLNEFKLYVIKTITDLINENITSASKREKYLSDLNKINNSHIKYFDLQQDQVDLITNILEYVKIQPSEFQKTYAKNFISGCARAYKGPQGMSCAKGVLERFVTELVSAGVVGMTDPTMAKPEYLEMIEIIENKTVNLKTNKPDYKSFFGDNTIPCFQQLKQLLQTNTNINATNEEFKNKIKLKYAECMKNKAGESAAASADFTTALEQHINELDAQDMFDKDMIAATPNSGGARRRKTRKVKRRLQKKKSRKSRK
jgi:Leucine-rich repeat (LRR) protein